MINHWIVISGHKNGFGSIRPHSFFRAVENVLFGRETKILCDSSVAGISQTLRWCHVLRHAWCMLAGIFLEERNRENNNIGFYISLIKNACWKLSKKKSFLHAFQIDLCGASQYWSSHSCDTTWSRLQAVFFCLKFCGEKENTIKVSGCKHGSMSCEAVSGMGVRRQEMPTQWHYSQCHILTCSLFFLHSSPGIFEQKRMWLPAVYTR